MKYFLIAFVFCLIEVSGFSQHRLIIGKVIEYKTQQPYPLVNIFINSAIFDITDNDGNFTIEADSLTSEDTLKVRFLSYFDLNFINFPDNLDTITLHNIPLFEYFTGYDMTDFFCGPLDFKCKRDRRIHLKTENERINNYYFQQNKLIEEYKYRFNNSEYHINLKNHCIDLNK